ncbi:hypothetical protein GCM10010420_51620 [Streptomyces glaucosporus]|uniref:Uncharacterized protein n=1 Tax=Streptomyces glaucosporus TaxID=284044 RepID=A0ABP5VYN3_9ACTN
MEAHEREPETTTGTESAEASGLRPRCAPVSMSELLASCAAADAVSTPPAAPEGRRERRASRAEAA